MSSPIQGSLAKDRLGVPSVVFFVLSAAAPLMVVAGVVTTGYATTGVLGIPLGFIAIAVVLCIFSVGYIAMSRHITNAGAFYTYVTQGLGRPFGVGAAWVALLAYNALQVGLYGIIGAAASGPLLQFFDIDVKWWVIALVAWLIVAILGVLRVDINGKVLAFLLCSEIIIVLIYDFAFVTKPGEAGIALDTLMPNSLLGAGLAATGGVLVLTFLGFTGFESSVVFSEESKNPRRTIAMATFLSLFIIGGLYALTSWAMSVAAGPDHIVAVSTEQSVGTIFGLAGERLSSVFVDIGAVLFATSVLASMISFHNTVARYTFALGRERVFPSLLSATGRRSGAPIGGSIVQSLLGLVTIILIAAFNRDPVLELFYYGGNGGGFGIMLLVTLTSLAVIMFFSRNRHDESAWARIIAPAISLILLIAVVYYAVTGFHNLLGLPEGAAIAWIIPAVYPVVFLLGILWALLLKVSRPEVYQAIGLGANTGTGISTQSRVLAEQYSAQHDASGQDAHR